MMKDDKEKKNLKYFISEVTLMQYVLKVLALWKNNQLISKKN